MRSSDSPPTHASTPRVWRRSPVLDSPTAQPISSSIVLNAHWNQLRSTYSISCLLRLPFMLSRYTIEVRAGIQCFTASLPSLFYSIGLKNIIPSDSRFMKACEGGDLETVREMMILGGGSPTDLDEFGKSALHVREPGENLSRNVDDLSESDYEPIFRSCKILARQWSLCEYCR